MPSERTFVRRGRFSLPMSICEPPHVIVSAARNFAVYTDEFLIVPPRQTGIASKPENAGLLKALALYLNSDFVTYHQFLTTPQLGIKREVGTLRSLKSLPIPFHSDQKDWSAWESLYDHLRLTEQLAVGEGQFEWYTEGDGAALLEKLNLLVNEPLDWTRRRGPLSAISFMFAGRSWMAKWDVQRSVRLIPKNSGVTRSVAGRVGRLSWGRRPARHRLTIVYDRVRQWRRWSWCEERSRSRLCCVEPADGAVGLEFEKVRTRLRERRSQWVYFERNLRMYEDTRTYLFKPMQRLHWTESQAFANASSIIADTLQPNLNEPTAVRTNAR